MRLLRGHLKKWQPMLFLSRLNYPIYCGVFLLKGHSHKFVPILKEYTETKSPEATQDFVQYMAGAHFFARHHCYHYWHFGSPMDYLCFRPGFVNQADKFALSVDLLRIVFPYILLISLSSFVGSILNAYHHFSIPAFTPTFLNISFIVFSLFLVPYFDPPVLALAWAVFGWCGLVAALFPTALA